MSKASKRVIIPFSGNDLQTIEDYQHEHKIKNRSEAIRCLIRNGAAQEKTGQQADLATAILVLRANRNELAVLGVQQDSEQSVTPFFSRVLTCLPLSLADSALF